MNFRCFCFPSFLHSSQHQKTPSKHPENSGTFVVEKQDWEGPERYSLVFFTNHLWDQLPIEVLPSGGCVGRGWSTRQRRVGESLDHFDISRKSRWVKYDYWIVFFSMAFKRFTSKKDAHQKYQKRHNSGNIDLWLHQNVSLVSVLLSLLKLLMIRFLAPPGPPHKTPKIRRKHLGIANAQFRSVLPSCYCIPRHWIL